MRSRIFPRLMGAWLGVCSIGAWSATPADALAPLSFLVGAWQSDDGQVLDTGGRSKGASTFSSEVGGALLLRRDHTELFDPSGQPTGGFDQFMTVYAEDEQIRADYVDGIHVIHYVSADVAPGQSVTFSSASGAGPVFRLRYVLETPNALKVVFGMIPPGQAELRVIATGTLHRR